MWRVLTSGMRARSRRLLGASSAIVVGVAFVSAALILGTEIRDGFRADFASSSEGVDAVIRSANQVGEGFSAQRPRIDPVVAKKLTKIDGIRAIVAHSVTLAQIDDADGNPIRSDGPPTLATNWIDDAALNSFHIVDGRAPNAPGEVAIDRATATKGTLRVGSATIVRVPEPLEVRVVGIAAAAHGDTIAGIHLAMLSDISALQHPANAGEARGGSPQADGVDELLVSFEPSNRSNAAAANVIRTMRSALPAGLEVVSGATIAAEQTSAINTELVNAVNAFLVGLALIALAVAAFSIHNTFSILAAQRSQEWAMLRAVGAHRWQVLRLTAAEAGLLAIVASAIGSIAGLGLAVGITKLANSSGVEPQMQSPRVHVPEMAAAILMGVVFTMAAAIGPAWRASRVPALAAMRASMTPTRRISRVRVMCGAILAGVGAVALAASALGGWSPGGVVFGVASFATVLGLMAVGSALAGPVASMIGSPIERLSRSTGQLARRNAGRDPARTWATASALVIGVSLVTLFMTISATLQHALVDTVARSMHASLIVESDQMAMSPEVTQAVNSVPGVDVVTAVGFGTLLVNGRAAETNFVDPATIDASLDVGIAAGSAHAIGPRTIAVSTGNARDHGWKLGSTVRLGYVDGVTDTVTIGMLYDSTDFAATMLVDAETYAQHQPNAGPSVLLIRTDSGADPRTVAHAIDKVTDRFGANLAQTHGEFVDKVSGGIAGFLNTIYVMLAISIVIAILGIGNTIALAVHERSAELGILRAIGQSRRQTRSMIRLEAAIVALVGTVVGVALGLFIAWAASGSIDLIGLDNFTVPVGSVGVVVVVGALAGLLAGARSARRVARAPVLALINRP